MSRKPVPKTKPTDEGSESSEELPTTRRGAGNDPNNQSYYNPNEEEYDEEEGSYEEDDGDEGEYAYEQGEGEDEEEEEGDEEEEFDEDDTMNESGHVQHGKGRRGGNDGFEQSYSGGFDQSYSAGFGDSFAFAPGKGEFDISEVHDGDDDDDAAPGEQAPGGSTSRLKPTKKRAPAARVIPKSEILNQVPFKCRDGEVELLSKTIERISLEWMENPPEVAWICGPSGCGKSTLVREVGLKFFKEVFVCRGTFEQHTMAVKPFKGLTDCLNDLIQRMQDNGGVDVWQPRLEEALGGEGPLLATIVPKLLTLLGMKDQPLERSALLVFDPNLRRRFDRLGYAIRDLIRTVAEYHPIVMILDNVHWADPDSLHMMKDLVLTKTSQNFLFMGCHEPIGDDHVLSNIQQEMTATEIRVTSLDLYNFHAANTRQLLFTMLAQEEDASSLQDRKITTLAQAIHEKTDGNPLFIVELLRAHKDAGLLKWSPKFNVWKWTVEKLVDATKAAPATLEGLVREQLKKQSKKLRLVISTAALVGLSHFRVDTLYSMISSLYKQGSPEPCPIRDLAEVDHFLRISCKKGYLRRTNKTGYYRFSHDAIRVASFKLPPPKKRGQLHFRMGLELSKLSVDARDKKLPEEHERLKYLAVDQLHRSAHGISDITQRAKVSKLYMEASECAIVKTAFRTAVSYLERGIELLDDTVRWEKQNYDLMSAMHLVLARMTYCCGYVKNAELQCRDLLDTRLKNLKDKMLTYRLMISILMDQKFYKEALALTLDVLSQLGVRFPTTEVDAYVSREVNKIRTILKEKKNHELLNLPRMTDKKALDIMFALYYLSKMGQFFDDSYHQEVACIRMMYIMLRAGYCRVTPMAFGLFSVCLADFNLHKEAYRIGRIAERLSRPGDTYGGQALAHFHANVSHWRRPYKKNLEPLLKNYNDQLDAGDFDHASLSIRAYVHHHIASGCDLDQLVDNLNLFHGLFQDYRMEGTWKVMIPMKMVINLIDDERQNPFLLFGNDIADQNLVIKEWEDEGVNQAVEEFYFLSMMLAVFFGDMEAADEMQMLLTKEADGVWIPYRAFFNGMIKVSRIVKSKGKKKLALNEEVDEIIDTLTEWYNNGATHVDPMIELLKAEQLCAIHGKGMSALRVRKAYDDAIRAAVEEKLVHLEAMANERAGVHFVSSGVDGWSEVYFLQAHQAYQRWGAFNKVADLERVHGKHFDVEHAVARSKRVGVAYRGQCKKPIREINIGNPQENTEEGKKGLKGLVQKAKKSVGSTNRKAKDLFKKDAKLDPTPAPWGWSSAGNLQMEDEEGDDDKDGGGKSPVRKSMRFGRKKNKAAKEEASDDDEALDPEKVLNGSYTERSDSSAPSSGKSRGSFFGLKKT
jgi:predicted ATPase